MASYCRQTHTHGGAAIYTREDIPVMVIGISEFSVEMIFEFCSVMTLQNDKKLYVISAYRVPDYDFCMFLDKLTFVLQRCTKLATTLF